MSDTPTPHDPTKLRPNFLESATNFVHSPLWHEIKACLMKRRSPAPQPTPNASEYAQAAALRIGWEAALDELEKLPSESVPDEKPKPLIPDTLIDERD